MVIDNSTHTVVTFEEPAAMTWVEHKFDVFVSWPGIKIPVRPVLSCFLSSCSGKLLVWRLDTAASFGLTFGDLVEHYGGILRKVVLDLDNKRGNEDLVGLFGRLGVEVHWASPYVGKVKPIERTFKALCETVIGANSNNDTAVGLNDFLALLDREITRHNAKSNRLAVAGGASW